MFPITLEQVDGTLHTVHPPCYGFLRGAEWTDWDQEFFKGDFSVKMVRRGRNYTSDRFTEDKPFGQNIYNTCETDGFESTPSRVMDLENLKIIWNSGARVPMKLYIESDDDAPTGWKFTTDNGTDFSYKESEATRTDSPLDLFNMKHDGLFVTMKQVMTDLEEAIDKGRKSCLVWDEERNIMGVNVVDIPCDRALFYLMVNRALDEYYSSDKIDTFLNLHYVKNIPIMLAFLISRVVQMDDKGEVRLAADNNDSCIVPTQNLWVGMGKRFKEPVAIEWQQHSYTDGDGHLRDDDMEAYEMAPVIDGYGYTSEDFNNTMFSAIIGGVIDPSSNILLDRPGGKPVANLVAELFRSVVSKEVYRNRGNGGNSYCSYWTSERSLYSTDVIQVAKPETWVDQVLSLLTEE